MSPTQKQIAKRLGVSQGIVSQITSGRRKPTTPLHQRILDECKTSGYTTNYAAKTLSTGRSYNLALVMPDFSYLADFNQMVVKGMWETAMGNGYSLIITSIAVGNDCSQDYLRLVRQNLVDGLFFMQEQGLDRIDLAELEQAGVKTVFVNSAHPDPQACRMMVDGTSGVASAMEHLISHHGKRRIAFASRNINSPVIEARFNGYKQAMLAAGLEMDPRLTVLTEPRTDFPDYYDQGTEAAEQIARYIDQIDAVVCAADDIAFGLINELRQRGIDCPSDLAVIGFDNLKHAKRFYPPLTSVACDGHAMGKAAMKIMLQQLDSKAEITPSQNDHLFETNLIIRNSCGCR